MLEAIIQKTIPATKQLSPVWKRKIFAKEIDCHFISPSNPNSTNFIAVPF